ncbi:MAG: hypothetical protein OXC26_22465 [Albidovulum sp.]|nr:hypothetical protein [Albidovulum sp.]
MPNSVAITNTYHTAEGLMSLARKCKDKNQSRRLRAIARLRGTRPRVPRDHRFGYCYLLSAIFPEAGVAVGHI